MEDEVAEKIKTLAEKWRSQWPNITEVIDRWERTTLNLIQKGKNMPTEHEGENMGIEGVEDMHSDPAPLEDAAAVEEQKREEEGIEPTEPTPMPDTEPPIEPPAEEPVGEPEPVSPPNPGGGNHEESGE